MYKKLTVRSGLKRRTCMLNNTWVLEGLAASMFEVKSTFKNEEQLGFQNVPAEEATKAFLSSRKKYLFLYSY